MEANSLLVTDAPKAGALAEAESSRVIQEIQAAMVIAKRFPRNEKECIDRIQNACSRPSLADQSVYCYARGGADITGPTIRLAEAVALLWGNIQFGIRELEQGNGESTVEAFAWDLETNTRQVKVFQVPHIRYSKSKGNTALTDPRDIYELVANNGARRLRACILGVIPGDIIEDAVRQCDVTLNAKADTSPEAQLKLIEAFATFGVTKEQIETRIQRRLDAITAGQIVQLKKVYASLRDGMSKPEEWFKVAEKSAAARATEAGPIDPFKQLPQETEEPAESEAAPAQSTGKTTLF